MVDKSRREELLRQFSDRPPQNGIFALKNAVTGEAWVGVSRNLDTQINGLRVRLNSNQFMNKDVQASWNAHGEDAFSYEVIERFVETDPYVLELKRSERAAYWREQLNAGTVKGM
jgi:hypothetical protein